MTTQTNSLRRLLMALLLCGGVAASTVPAAAPAAPAGATQTVEYEYDQYGRLSRVVYQNQVELRYQYDANGNLTRRTVKPLGDAG